MNRARLITRSIRARAAVVADGIRVTAKQTSERSIYKPLRVSPQEAQMLAWITPSAGVDYRIVTQMDWWLE